MEAICEVLACQAGDILE
ncbi:hypothetical protein [Algoriphagus sp. Y33]